MIANKFEVLIFITLLASAVNTRSVDTVSMRNVQMDADETATGDICQDCTQIFELLMDLLSNQDFQAKLIGTLDKLCDKMPAQITTICHSEVEKMLPLAISFIANIMKPAQICSYLGLCKGHDSGKMKDLFLNHISKTVTMPTMKLETSIPCSLCTYIVNTLESLLPKEKTESEITALLEHLCSLFPSQVQQQCNMMVEKYIKLLIDLLLNKTSANFICKILHLCGITEEPVTAGPVRSDCDACLTLAVLSRMHLGSNATEHQTASFLDSVCHMHPNAMPKCMMYTRRYGKQLFMFLGQDQEALDVCKKASLCVTGESEPVSAADPCTLGISYRCKDFQTALDCGAVSFCQEKVWE